LNAGGAGASDAVEGVDIGITAVSDGNHNNRVAVFAAGVAATLTSLSPVFILPAVAWLERERITWRAVAGAVVAVTGVAVLTAFDGNGPPADGATDPPPPAAISETMDER